MVKVKLEHRNLTPVAVKRLSALCDFFEKMPKKLYDKFDMSHFFLHRSRGHDHKVIDSGVIDPKVMHVCGTSACALGWAASIPAFQKAGLKMEISVSRETGYNEKGKEVVVAVHATDAHFTVSGSLMGPVEAATRFFEIPEEMVNEIFGSGPDGGVDEPKEWAKGVRYIIQTDATRYYPRHR